MECAVQDVYPHRHTVGHHPAFAKQKNCDQIVMGTRGLGKVAVFLLGSVAMKVLQLAEIPATSVK
jgi:nucleotide-binding universal stress UspA family protein